MNILFLTFPVGHLVSDKEFDRLKKGFAKVGMNLLRDPSEGEFSVVMVKGWSHTWQQVLEKVGDNKPIVYYSIGTEWKIGEDLKKLNEPIADLYKYANAVVHVSSYCWESHDSVFGYNYRQMGEKELISTIIPACEPNLPKEIKYPPTNKLKLATTCIPRPVKRVDQLEELCKKYNVELVPAYGSVSDFSYYHDCDGYIHLSRKEGMPNTVLEALSYGLPCIVTNYGGAKEAVGDAGVVINNDPEGVAWDPSNIEPIDEILFQHAISEFRSNLYQLRMKVRSRVLTELNDYVTACKFKELFESL